MGRRLGPKKGLQASIQPQSVPGEWGEGNRELAMTNVHLVPDHSREVYTVRPLIFKISQERRGLEGPVR